MHRIKTSWLSLALLGCVAACSGGAGQQSLPVSPQAVTNAQPRKTPVAGTLYVAVAGQNQIEEYPVDSTKLSKSIDTGFVIPNIVAIGGNDVLYAGGHNVGKNSYQILEYAYGQTTPQQTITLPHGFTNLMAVDRRGDLYVQRGGKAFTLAEFKPGASKPSRVVTSKLFVNPRGVATDSSGDLFIADAGANAIFRVAPSGNAVQRLHLDLLPAIDQLPAEAVGIIGSGVNQTIYVSTGVGVLEFLPGQSRAAQLMQNGIVCYVSFCNPELGGGGGFALVTAGADTGTFFYLAEDGIAGFPPNATSSTYPYEIIWNPGGEPQTFGSIAVAPQ